LEQLKAEFQNQERVIRQKSVSASRRTLVGKFIERFVPFLEQVKYEPADMHFLGSPVDYVVFKGLHEDQVTEVVFLEVKTGDSLLTKRERSLRDAVSGGQVRWQELRIGVASEDNPNIATVASTPALRELYEKIERRVLESASALAFDAKSLSSAPEEEADTEYDVTCKGCGQSFKFRFTDQELKHGRRVKCPRCAAVGAYDLADL